MFLSLTVTSYAQLGVSDTTGIDTVYFYSSGWCAKVDVYASSDNVYADAGEFCVAATLSDGVDDGVARHAGEACAATLLSFANGANPDSVMVQNMSACSALSIFTQVDTLRQLFSGSCAAAMLHDSVAVLGSGVVGARICAATAASQLPAGMNADSVLVAQKSYCSPATSFAIVDTATSLLGSFCSDGHFCVADGKNAANSVMLACAATATSAAAGKNVDSIMIEGSRDCGELTFFHGEEVAATALDGFCSAVHPAASAGAALKERMAGDACVSVALSELPKGANPDSMHLPFGGECSGVTVFSSTDAATQPFGGFCSAGRLALGKDEHGSNATGLICAATALSQADGRNPDSILMSGESFCAPATMFMREAGVGAKLGGHCFNAVMQGSLNQLDLFKQVCAATPLSIAKGRNPDSIMMQGESFCAPATMFAQFDNISTQVGNFCSEGRFSFSKIDIMDAFMGCARIRIPSAVDITFIGARFDDREWGFKAVPNNLLWLCSPNDPITLQVRASSPATFSWYLKNDPERRLSSADTLHLSPPVKEGEYYAVGYGYGNNVSPTMTVKICDCDFVKTSQSDTTVYTYTNSKVRLLPRIAGGNQDERYNKYQWFVNGAPYSSPSATSVLLMNTGATASVHKLVARAISPCDTLDSDTITLVVCAPVAKVNTFSAHTVKGNVNLLAGSKVVDVCLNTNLELRAAIRGATEYRWYRDGVLVASGKDTVYKVSESMQFSHAGLYRVVGYNRCGDTASASATVNVEGWLSVKQPLPQALTVCEGSSITLKYAVENAKKYVWTKGGVSIAGAGDSTLLLSALDTLASGRYVVQASNSCDMYSDTLDLTVTPRAHASILSADTMACAGGSFSFVATALYADSMKWYHRGDEVGWSASYIETRAKLTDSGTYTLVAYNVCTNDTLPIHLYVSSSIGVEQPMPDTTYYYEGRALRLAFKAKEALGYRWHRVISGAVTPIDGAGSDSIYLKHPAELADSGYYVAEAYNGCGTVRDTALAVAYPRTRITLPLRDTLVCEGQPLYLKADATLADSVAWYRNGVKIAGGAGAFALNIAALAVTDTGRYLFIATNRNNSDTTACTVRIMMSLRLKTPLNGGADTLSLCESRSLRLLFKVDNANFYLWRVAGATDTISTDTLYALPHALPEHSGKYIAEARNACGALADTVVVAVNPAVHITYVTPDVDICAGDTLRLTATAAQMPVPENIAWQWRRNGVLVGEGSKYTNPNTLMADSGTYALVASYPNGCGNDSAKVHVTVHLPLKPVTLLTQDSLTVCEGDSVGFTFAVENTQGYYWYRDSVSDASVVKRGAPADSVFSIPRVSVSHGGRYIVKAANACGSLFDTVYVTALPSPHVALKYSDLLACPESPLQLAATASGYDSIAWRLDGVAIATNLLTIDIHAMRPVDAGRYVVEAYNSNGCASDSAVVNVGVRPALSPYITLPDDTLYSCEGAPLSLTFAVTNAMGYRWLRNGVALPCDENTLTIGSLLPDSAGVYKVFAYSLCDTLRDSVTVTLRLRAKLTERPAERIVLCESDSLVLKVGAENADSVAWFHGGKMIGRDLVSIKPSIASADSGWYAAVAYNSCGNDTATTFVEVSHGPVSILSPLPDKVSLCEGDTLRLRLEARNASSYRWHKNGEVIPNATTATYRLAVDSMSTSGVYVAQAINGCDTVSDTVAVTLRYKAHVLRSPVPNIMLCLRDELALASTTLHANSVVWYHNGNRIATSESYNKMMVDESDAGSYVMVAYGSCGNDTSSATQVVVSTSEPSVITNLPDTVYQHLNTRLELKLVARGAVQYQWYRDGEVLHNATDSVLVIKRFALADSGVYTVEAGNGCGVEMGETNVVALYGAIITGEPADMVVCVGAPFSLSAEAIGYDSLTWFRNNLVYATDTLSIGSDSATHLNSGSYQLVAHGKYGNDTSALARIYVNTDSVKITAPLASGLNTLQSCLGKALLLSVSAGDATYTWSKSDTQDVLLSGVNLNSFDIHAFSPADIGYYSVTIDNGCDVQSDSVYVGTFKVASASLATAGRLAICEGAPLEVAATAKGYDSVAWLHNGRKVDDRLTFGKVRAGQTDAGLYRLVAYGPCNSDTTAAVRVEIAASLSVTTSLPDTIETCQGAPLTLRYKAKNAEGYRWYKNGKLLPTATDSLLTFDALSLSDAGVYAAKSFNGCGAVSDSVVLKVMTKLHIAALLGDTSICLGSDLTLHVEVADADSVAWLAALPNGRYARVAGGDAYTISAAKYSDSGRYVAVAYGLCGVDTSAAMHVILIDEVYTSGKILGSVDLCEGQNLELSFKADNADGYQWYYEGEEIIGATDSTLQKTGMTLADTGRYAVEAYNTCDALRDVVTVTVSVKPTITTQPQDVNVCIDSSLMLIAAAGSTDSVAWYCHGRKVGSADTLTIAAVAEADSGDYYFVAYGHNGCGVDTSRRARVEVSRAISVVMPLPDSLRVCEGESRTLHLFANNVTGGYRWYKDGALIPTATTRSLALNSIGRSDAGQYVVEAYNGSCASVFDTVTLRVNNAARIAPLPADTMLCISNKLRLSAAATDADSVAWFYAPTGKQLNSYATLSLSNLTLADSGVYICVAYSSCRNDTAKVRVLVSNALVENSLLSPDGSRANMLCENQPLRLSFNVSNALHFAWYKDDSLMVGYTDSIFEVSRFTESMEGLYVAVAKNGCGVASDTLMIKLNMPAEIIVPMPDTILLCRGDELELTAEALADNVAWFHNGREVSDNEIYSVPATTMSDGGSYTFIAYGSCGNDTSAAISLLISESGATATQPLVDMLRLREGEPLRLVFKANKHVLYRWTKDGGNLSNATDSVYFNPAVSMADEGRYNVMAYNGCDTLYDDIYVAVEPCTHITGQPTDTMVCNGKGFALTAKVNFADSIVWFKQNAGRVGEGLTYAKSSSTLADDGSYYVVAYSSVCKNDTSSVVAVYVDDNMSVNTPLRAMGNILKVCKAAPLRLTFNVSNAVQFLWYKNDKLIAEATDSVYAVLAADTLTAGTYVAVAMNGCGVLSDTVTVKVNDGARTGLITISSSEVCQGEPFTISSSATSYDSLVWRHNGVRVATGSTLSKAHAALSDSGAYRLIAYNACGNDTSNAVSLKVFTAVTPRVALPNFLKHCEADTMTLRFVANMAARYYWYYDRMLLQEGASDTLYTQALALADSGRYIVIAVNSCNVISDTVSVKVNPQAVASLISPDSVHVCPNEQLTLSATVQYADSVAWFHERRGKVGSNPLYVVARATLADSGAYRMVSYNACGNDTTPMVRVSVSQILQSGSVFTSDTLRLCEGEQLRLRYSSRGATGYSWYKNGTLLRSGVVDTLLRINAVTPSDAGRYVVTSYSACDTLRDTVAVIINAAPAITAQPTDTSVCDGNTAVRTFLANNAISYAWYTLSGVQISANNTLSVKSSDIFYGGRYYGAATNGCHTVYTDTIEVHIGSALQLHQGLPDRLTLCEGEKLTLSLVADNLFRTRWVHNKDTLSITDSTYHVSRVSLSDTGLYIVKGYNGCGAIFDTTYVVVKALPRFTLQPRDTSLCGAGTATLTAHADNIAGAIQWYKKGSGIQGSGNVLSTTAAGFYYALAQNSCDTISSDTV
ncbi:MAG: hypothetical protein LBT94_00115, partial [Prevotellaceae bacterium]|nr:hypothetical protein [Prevotellaceae bacterium]